MCGTLRLVWDGWGVSRATKQNKNGQKWTRNKEVRRKLVRPVDLGMLVHHTGIIQILQIHAVRAQFLIMISVRSGSGQMWSNVVKML